MLSATIKGDKLLIEIDANLTSPPPSSTGKTLSVASTHGNQPTTVTIKGKPLIIGLNAYIKQ